MAETNEFRSPSNIPIPDPSLATTAGLKALRDEVKGWVEALQILHEGKIESGDKLLLEKISGGLENINTRLNGNDTALVAALKAQKEEAANQTGTFKEVLAEFKRGMEKQFDAASEKIDDLKKRMFESGGKAEGIGSTVSMIIAALAALASIISAVVILSRAPSAPSAPSARAPIVERQGISLYG